MSPNTDDHQNFTKKGRVMKIKLLAVAALMAAIAAQPAIAGPMSVNVSGPGAVNPFTGYRTTYTDKDRNSCAFRFNLPGDGLAYLTADRECPSFVTEKRVFMDAQNFLKHMNIVSSAPTFSEYFGDDGHGHKVKTAPLHYRCVKANEITVDQPLAWAGSRRGGMSGYMFMPKKDIHLDGWYQLDYYPNGYRPHQFTVGVWRPLDNNTIVAVDKGRNFTVSQSKVNECPAHPID